MNPARRRAIFRRFQQANPSPTTELEHSTPFELLTAVMLSAHTTDKSVNAATRKLFPIANTPEKIAALGVEGVKPYLKTVGLYNMKSKNLIAMCQIIVEKHGGQVPKTREELEELPGVGRKTANIILNMVFGETTIAVDTHIFRVSNRTGLAPGKNPLIVEQELNATTPQEYRKDAHHWLLLHGRYVCVARVPLCPKCIIADLCEYPNKTPPKEESKTVRRVGPLADRAEAKAAAGKAAVRKASPLANRAERKAAVGKTGSVADRAEPKAAVRKVASAVRARASRAGRALLLKPRAGR